MRLGDFSEPISRQCLWTFCPDLLVRSVEPRMLLKVAESKELTQNHVSETHLSFRSII